MNLTDKNTQKTKESIITRLSGKFDRWMFGICTTICTVMSAALPVGAVKINDNMDADKMIGGIIDMILEVARYMGFVVVASGIFMFVFAYKDDNAEAQARAARFAVVGAILLSLKSILKMTGLIT